MEVIFLLSQLKNKKFLPTGVSTKREYLKTHGVVHIVLQKQNNIA
jgi:hypothetical protein